MRESYTTRFPACKINCRQFLLLSLFLILSLSDVIAQGSIRVQGTVRDSKGTALSGINVVIKGGSTGTATDVNGNFAINVPSQKSVLVISGVGFQQKEITAGSQKQMEITLNENAANLEEVVVIGYGTQKKRDVTGAITSVNSKQITERQPINIFDAIQGQAPGVLIATESGRPGATSSIRIRGTATLEGGADPLYIVDGAQGVNIDGINPADIESIEILKDAASAAIYGARSANGVIIITTKRGKEGRPKISVNYLTTFGQLSHKVPQANAAERRILDAKRSSSGVSNRPTDSLNPGYNADNDYQDMLTRTGKRNQIDLSVSGGAKIMNYYASLGYVDDEGIIINSWAKIARGRFNVDFKPNDKFSFGSRIQGSYQKENRIDEGRTLQQAIQRPPNFRIYFQDGSLSGLIGGRRNPVAEALLDKNNYDIYDGSINNYISYNFLKELKFTGDATVRANYNHNLVFMPKLVSSANPLNNFIEDQTELNTYWQVEGYFNYDKTIGGNHKLTGVLGASADEGFKHSSDISGTNLLTESILTINSAQIKNPADTREEKYFSTSAFARLGYAYKGKYLLNSTLRADASSRFGKDNRWGFFPSASVGWRFSDEKFMDWAGKYLDDGKLRVSYGITGNDRIGPYESIQRYVFGSNYYNNGTSISGVAPNNIFGNNTLSWESQSQFNIGMDLVLLKGRLNFTADYYDKITSKLLYSAPLPSNTGFSGVKVNVGSIQNRGFEFVIGGYPLRMKNLQWNISYNMSFNNNTVKDLYNGTTLLPGGSGNNNLWKVSEGGRLGDFYGYKALGVYAWDQSNAWTSDYSQQLTPVFTNGAFSGYTLNGKAYTGEVKHMYTNGNLAKGGDMIWLNVVQDSVIDDNDRIVLGNAQPKWIAGLSNLVTYKQLTLSFAFYISWGGKIYNAARSALNSNATSNVTPEPVYIEWAWWHQGDQTIYPIASNNGLGNSRDLSSLYLEDASFIRLRNVRLSYELPRNLSSKVKLNGVSVFLYGTNLITWTKYTWYDPEISFQDPLTPGKDTGRYPKKREWGGGLNLNF